MACYVVNTSASDDSGKKKCSPVLEDYYECLHHKKEVRFWESKMCWAETRSRELTNRIYSMRERWRYKLRMPELNQRRLETMRRARARSGTWGFWGRRRIQKRCLGRGIEATDTARASIFSA